MEWIMIIAILGIVLLGIVFIFILARNISRGRTRKKSLKKEDLDFISPPERATTVRNYFGRGFIRTRGDLEDFLYFWGDLPIPTHLDRDCVEAILLCVHNLGDTLIMVRGGHANAGEIIPFMRSMFTQSK